MENDDGLISANKAIALLIPKPVHCRKRTRTSGSSYLAGCAAEQLKKLTVRTGSKCGAEEASIVRFCPRLVHRSWCPLGGAIAYNRSLASWNSQQETAALRRATRQIAKALLNVRNDRRYPPGVLIDYDKALPGYQILTACISFQHLYSFGRQVSQFGLSRH